HSLGYCTQKTCRELIDKDRDIASLDTHPTVIPNEIPSLTRLVQLGFHQSVLADSSSKEGPLGQLNSLVNEITNTTDSQTSAYFHSAVHSLVKSFYELYNMTTLSVTDSQQKRSFWCYYERTFGELKRHSEYYSPPYNRNEYNTVLSKLFTLRTQLTTLALQIGSPSVLTDMDTVLSNPSIVELMTRMQLNDFNDSAGTELQPEVEMMQINNRKWTLNSLARLCADQEFVLYSVDQTLQLCNRLPGYPVNFVPRIETTFAVWISEVTKRSQLSDTMETSSCTARRLLISSDTLKTLRSQCEWIRDVTYQLWSLQPIATRLLTHLAKLYEELNLVSKIPQPSSGLCREPTLWNCVFQFNWARLVCWTRNVLVELHHQAEIIEDSEVLLNLHQKWLPSVRERLPSVHITVSNHEIDVDFFSKEIDRLDSLYLELIGEKGCQMEEIHRKLEWILGDLSTNNNGLLVDRLLNREQQLWSAYQSLKLQVEQRRHLACQQFIQFVERLHNERTSTDQVQLQQTICSFTRSFYVQYSKFQQYASEPLKSSSLVELNKHLFHLTGVYIRLQTWLPVLLQLASVFDQTASDGFRLFELAANWLNLMKATDLAHQKLSDLSDEYQKLTSDMRQLNRELTEFRRYSEFLSGGVNHTFITCGLLEDSSYLHKLLTKWRSDLLKRLKALKLSLLQLTSSSVVLRLNEPGTFSKTTHLTIHVVIKPCDLNGRIRELDRWLCTMRQQLDYQEKAILNTWYQWEATESALDRSEGELDFLIQSVSHFRPLPLIGNHSECPWNYLLRSVGRIKHLITDRTGRWRTYSESEIRLASETVNEWSKFSEVYSQYTYIGGRLISYLQKFGRPTELTNDVIQVSPICLN
ncbi:hypothetical protein AHF37_12146, partial [Paragonimus kellicotti]